VEEPDGATVRFSLSDPNRDGSSYSTAGQRPERGIEHEAAEDIKKATGSVRGGSFVCGRRGSLRWVRTSDPRINSP